TKASALNLVHPTSGLDTDQMTHRFGIIHHLSFLLHSNLQYRWLFLLGTYLKSYDSVFSQTNSAWLMCFVQNCPVCQCCGIPH
ncbi:hypothetical protein J008_04171, partial [Cryptococcus neoformans]